MLLSTIDMFDPTDTFSVAGAERAGNSAHVKEPVAEFGFARHPLRPIPPSAASQRADQGIADEGLNPGTEHFRRVNGRHPLAASGSHRPRA